MKVFPKRSVQAFSSASCIMLVVGFTESLKKTKRVWIIPNRSLIRREPIELEKKLRRVSIVIIVLCCFSAASTVAIAQVNISEQDLNETVRFYKTTNPIDSVKVLQSKMPAVITDGKKRQEILQNLPETVRKLKVEDAEITEKFRSFVVPVLKLYGREKSYDIIIFRHKTPVMFSDTGVALVVSTGMIERAESDDELLGYVAHEVGHEYFAAYSIFSKHLLKLVLEGGKEEVLHRKIEETLAVVELQCDSFAALSLARLDYNPLAFIEGMERIGHDFPNHAVGFHPPDAARRKLVEQIVPVKNLQTKTRLSNRLKELKRLIQLPNGMDQETRGQ